MKTTCHTHIGTTQKPGNSPISACKYLICMTPASHLGRQMGSKCRTRAEKLKAGIRAKLEHPFRVIKRPFGFVKVRYRDLKKNTAQLITLFALSNLWMVRCKLMGAQG